ncbi:MAG: Zn-dependent hydrolase [Bacteroidales bacterium]|nr:Zn-dependent hydrolase [Bacteroidales bacterium]MDD2322402.1 Zn-dependent hydrolase [Bacteroidales bacterium]MDD3960788.1 Zn-dependent hydrolase [Bacteroidales bacterium]MDY0285227.1 Zn-dependent hydrolase [Bacteroidales bacterium]HPE87252.1 Zn-dependent hydrolase [Bacteroidales bacterium]
MAIVIITISCSTPKQNDMQNLLPQDQAFLATHPKEVDERVAIFAPFTLTADISHLSDNEKQILSICFDVADIMETLYWKQTIGNRDNFLNNIADENTKKFAVINYGPWDRLDGNRPFIEGVGEKPAGANFYPPDMTKAEFESLPDPDKTSLYTLIRRDKQGALKVIPYREAYKKELTQAAKMLKKAAALAEDPGLKKYLELRADALITDNYQPSDFAWMEMQNANIDFVTGPIENYEDALFGYKAAFESFVLIKDLDWSAKLTKFSAMLPDLQAGLPIEENYKKDVPGSKADMNVYDVVYYRGDCNAGSKTIAINLPNDEEVHIKFGSRKLQLKNAMKAKFDKILVPISDVLIDPAQRKYIKFNAFFENTMFHEVGHAMGIKTTVDGSQTVREALKEQYSAIEEGKADIMGLYLVTKLYEMGELTEGEVMDNYVTFFAGIFRSSRFGAASAHGKANMMRMNYFEKTDAYTRNDDGTYTIHFNEMQEAMISLMQKILHVQGDGDYEAAKAWVEQEGIIKPQLQSDLDRLGYANIPVDIIFDQGKDKLGL